MNFDEQKLKRLDNIRLNDNQYENVTSPDTQKNLKMPEKLNFLAFFFVLSLQLVTMYIQCSNLDYFCKFQRG